MRNSDINAYIEKVKVKKDAQVINDVILNDPDTFAGMYYDSEEGKIIVQITKDSKQTEKKLLENVNYKENINFNLVKYSLKKLTSAQDTIREKAIPGSVKALIP